MVKATYQTSLSLNSNDRERLDKLEKAYSIIEIFRLGLDSAEQKQKEK